MKKLLNNQKGFTLVELIIVIAILAVIAGIAIPNLINNINNSRKTADIANGKSIASIVAKVIAENDNITLAGTATDTYVVTASTAANPSTLQEYVNTQVQGTPKPKFQAGSAGVFYYSVTTSGVISVYANRTTSAASGGDMVFPTPDTIYNK